MSTQVGSLGLYNQYNPYSSGLMSDDFYAQQMYQSYNETNGEGQKSKQTSFQGHQQPQTDTFEKSSGFTTGLVTGGGLGGATAAGMYFFGSNPMDDKGLKAGFIEKFGEEYQKFQTEKILKDNNIKPGIFKELMDFEGDDLSKLSQETREYLSSKNITDAKGIKSHLKPITDKILETDINFQNQKLAGYKKLEEAFKALPDRKKETVAQFVKEHIEELGLKGATKEETRANVRQFLEDCKRQNISCYRRVKTLINEGIAAQQTAVTNASNVLDEVVNLWDSDKKAFKAGTTTEITEACTKAFKNFKWKTAGKWGAIAAAAGLVLGWMFGGSSNK